MPISISGDGPITGITSLNTTVSSTELGYLDGTTSAIQTQFNNRSTYSDWQSYTPTIGGTTLGNGSVSISYTRVGRLVFCDGYITFGSTTVMSSGITFSVPVAVTNSPSVSGTVRLFDSSAGSYWQGHVQVYDNKFYFFVPSTTTSTTVTYINSNAPFTWATGDSLAFSVFYGAAQA